MFFRANIRWNVFSFFLFHFRTAIFGLRFCVRILVFISDLGFFRSPCFFFSRARFRWNFVQFFCHFGIWPRVQFLFSVRFFLVLAVAMFACGYSWASHCPLPSFLIFFEILVFFPFWYRACGDCRTGKKSRMDEWTDWFCESLGQSNKVDFMEVVIECSSLPLSRVWLNLWIYDLGFVRVTWDVEGQLNVPRHLQ